MRGSLVMTKRVLTREQKRDLALVERALLEARMHASRGKLEFISYLVDMALIETERTLSDGGMSF